MVKDMPAMQETQVPSLDQGMIPRRRECLPTPGFLPGESHRWRNLVGYSPWGRKESDTTERLTLMKHCITIPKSKKPQISNPVWPQEGWMRGPCLLSPSLSLACVEVLVTGRLQCEDHGFFRCCSHLQFCKQVSILGPCSTCQGSTVVGLLQVCG